MKYCLESPWLPASLVPSERKQNVLNLMLRKQIGNSKYKSAIKEVVKAGDVVLDLGVGTGILSLWALEAGASRVYGVDCDAEALSLAVDRMNSEGYGKKFIPINGASFDITLPERMDVIASETMGNLGDNEGIQKVLNDAYPRFAKPDFRAIPLNVKIYLVPVSAERAHDNVAAKNVASLNPHYDLKKMLADKKQKSVFNLYYDALIAQSCHLSLPQVAKEYSDRWQQSSTYSKHLNFIIEKKGVFTGFKGYFIAQLSNLQRLDISGDRLQRRTTSEAWRHAYLPVSKPIKVKAGDCISLLYTRRNPLGPSWQDQVYRWQGCVLRNNQVIHSYDQSLDEELLRPDD